MRTVQTLCKVGACEPCQADLSGSMTGASTSIDAIQRSAAWIVRDFGSPSVRIGGDGTNAFASHFSTGNYVLSVTDTLDRVLFAPSPSAPMGGTFDLAINVQRTREGADPADRTFDVAAKIDFTGGDNATLLLDGTESFSLTLSTGAVARL